MELLFLTITIANTYINNVFKIFLYLTIFICSIIKLEHLIDELLNYLKQ